MSSRTARPSKRQKRFLRRLGLTIPPFARDCERLIAFLKAGNKLRAKKQRVKILKRTESRLLGSKVINRRRIGNVLFLSSARNELISCVSWEGKARFSFVPALKLRRVNFRPNRSVH